MQAEDLVSTIDQMVEERLARIRAAATTEALERERLEALGKKGQLTLILRQLGQAPAEERRRIGQAANAAKEAVEAALAERACELAEAELAARLERERVDVTLPAQPARLGHPHPLQMTRQRLEEVFIGLGFQVVEGPEVESDLYNFEALNVPPGHPARDAQDSFYLTDDVLLRTHTSPMQVRHMRRTAPALPVRAVVPGRVYRRDADDATHSHMFFQMEGLVVDRGIRLSDLRGTLALFARELFGPETAVRFRPSYFPFTEPSVEVDVSCPFCHGGRAAGCRVCKGEGFIEILGAGMVHPNVLRAGGYDPDEVTGFAFGMGIDRITMLRHGIEDIRLLFTNDQRWLEHFSGEEAGR